MTFPPGKYTISNVHHENFACLPSSDDQEHVVGATDPESTTHQWILKAASVQGRYSIQNVEFSGYLWAGPRPQKGEEIIAMSERKTWWKIIMESDEKYWICPVGSADLSWSLSDVHDETPIQLQSTNSNPRCLWKILPLPSEIPTTSGSNVSKNSQGQDRFKNGTAAYHQKRYVDAEGILKEALAHRRLNLGDKHKDTLYALHWLGLSIYRQARYADAEEIFQEAVAGRQQTRGDQHENTLNTLYWLGQSIYEQRRYADAETIYKEVLAGQRRIFGDQHKETLCTLHWLGFSIYRQARYADAEEIFQEAVAGRQHVLGNQHKNTLTTLYWLEKCSAEKPISSLRPATELPIALNTPVYDI